MKQCDLRTDNDIRKTGMIVLLFVYLGIGLLKLIHDLSLNVEDRYLALSNPLGWLFVIVAWPIITISNGRF